MVLSLWPLKALLCDAEADRWHALLVGMCGEVIGVVGEGQSGRAIQPMELWQRQ